MAYDSKCYDLAEAFLEDEPHLNTEKRRDALAQLIQTAIEDFISDEQSNYEPPDPPGWEGGFAPNHRERLTCPSTSSPSLKRSGSAGL